MKKEELRKVRVSYYSDKKHKNIQYDGLFHQWADTTTEVVWEDKDCEYLKNTMGIVEDFTTGEVDYVNPCSITFLT